MQSPTTTIVNSITQNSIIYLSIGSGMNNYGWPDEIKQFTITPQNNQQYPFFLDIYGNKNKTIILIDELLENPLKIQEYYARNMLPLKQNIMIEEKNKIFFRHHMNNNTNVFALNDMIEYTESDKYFSLVLHLIEMSLSMNCKLILQDFTGRDTSNYFRKFLNIFGNDMMENVTFDIFESDGECFANFNPDNIIIDSNGNFHQNKFKKLTNIDKNIDKYIHERIKLISNEVSYHYLKLMVDCTYEIKYVNQFYYMFNIYNIEFDENNMNPQYILDKYKELIFNVVKDIVTVRHMEHAFAEHIMQQLVPDNRIQFINTLSILNAN